jgi:MscS family membrane protein
VVFVTLLVGHIISKLLDRAHLRLEKTKNLWDDALAVAIKPPLKMLIWVIGTTFSLEIVYKYSKVNLLEAIYPIRDVLVIATLAWFANRLIKEFQKNILHRSQEKGKPVDRTTLDAVTKILRVAVLITALLVTLQTLGFSISGVLAFGGVGGLAIGFAAKDLLANFFGALMIYFDRPFKVGDWIRSPDKDIEGTVDEIGWRQTRIITFDKRPIYVPNSLFSTIVVQNPSRMTHRRIYETIGVRYDDISVLPTILADVKSMLVNHPEIDETQTLMVSFNSFGASSLDFFIYSFTKTTIWTEYHDVKQEVLLKISDIIASHKAEIAYPTTTVHLQEPLMQGANS